MKHLESNISNLTAIFIVGQTASGKSGLAMSLAQKMNGEIVCADSQTLRKDLDIGTAKPSKEDRLLVKHHMLDVIGPYKRFSVAEFQSSARLIIMDIISRGKLPIVVGGTGLYIDSLFYGYELEAKNDEDEKKHLEGMSVLELKKNIISRGYKMPTNQNNPRHLVGVILRKGLSSENIEPAPNSLIYGLMHRDSELKNRISSRIDEMFEIGLVEEVKEIISKYGKPPEKLDAIGYEIISEYLEGNISEDEARELFKKGHWQYARRQKAWFKRNKYIQWFDDYDVALQKIIQDINTFKG